MKPTCSLNISTYNWPIALQHCLQTLLWQTVLPTEIVIADDGSKAETKTVIEAFAAQCPVPVIHVWQPDNGFQLPKIRNKAIIQSTGDYIIQIDGDCLLHPKFIEDHLYFAKHKTFVCGTRGMLHEKFTNNIFNRKSISFPLAANKQLSKKYNVFYSRILSIINYYIQTARKNYLYVIGCNMAFWKNDLFKVNGYNEDFIGWGKEDNDIALRLINSGVGIRFLKFGAIQYHLYHKSSDTSKKVISEALLHKTVVYNLTYTPNGIDKY